MDVDALLARSPRDGAGPDTPASFDITVIVPTLNERENIPEIIPRIVSSLRDAGLDAEILFVDGGSTDGTPRAIKQFGENLPVRLLETQGKGGLAGDVIRAAGVANGRFVAVMDADLSHPPEKLPDLLRPLLLNHCDMTIGSRHVPGGSIPDWSWRRRLASRCGALLSLPFVDAKDPMSGFFAIGRGRLLELGREAEGFKIGLEILARGGDALRVREIPIEFHDRRAGHTKFGSRQVVEYLRQLARLTGGRPSAGATLRWGVVGLLGMGLDIGLFTILYYLGFGVLLSHSTSFLTAVILNFLLNWKWAFRTGGNMPGCIGYLVTCVLAYILRAGLIAQVVEIQHWPPQIALVMGILLGAIVNYVGSAWFVFRRVDQTGASSIRWRVLALAVVAYSVVLRLLYGGVMNLLPEEAYYWNYAQHLDYGYLDHPPMVAWMIWLTTGLLGHYELAVRLPAMLCWIGTAYFVWKSARMFFDKTTALVAMALLACLPVFLLTGLFTTPDAFLYLFWTGCVYSIQCAVLLNRKRAWYAAGLFAGLGLLSKYTMGLFGLSVIVFMLIDRRGRRWWRRPEPYLAVLIAAAVFSPVIVWNAQHNWASFLFQSARRMSHKPEFSLFPLLGAMIVLMTPFGVIGSIRSVLPQRLGGVRPRGHEFSLRAKRLTACMLFVPLAVFAVFSMRHEPKLNWAGVAFLAALPFLAGDICSWNSQAHAIVRWSRKMWPTILVGLLLLLGFLGFYSTSGFPGAAPTVRLHAYSPLAWRELSRSVEDIRERISKQTRLPAVVVGMNKYFISSELAFYNGPDLADGTPRVVGRGIFPNMLGTNRALMWDSWVPRQTLTGRPVVLIAFDREHLEEPGVANYFDRISPIQRQGANKNAALVAAFYWRVGYGYNGNWNNWLPRTRLMTVSLRLRSWLGRVAAANGGASGHNEVQS